jgi:hypothetical protein
MIDNMHELLDRVSQVPQVDRPHGTLAPEQYLPPAMVGAFGYTICLFLSHGAQDVHTGSSRHCILVLWLGLDVALYEHALVLPRAYGKWSVSALTLRISRGRCLQR